jgi:hypothetical protein
MTAFPEIGLVGAIALVLAAPLTARVIRRRFDPFEPMVLFVLAYGVMFVARPLSMIITDQLSYEGPRGSTDVSGTFVEMLVIALIGALAFVVGYETPFGSRLANAWRGLGDITAPWVVRAALAIGGLGMASFLVFVFYSAGLSGFALILRGRSSELSSEIATTTFYLWYSSFLLVPAALVLLAVGLERRQRTLIFVAVALGSVFLLRTLPLGARIAILPFLGGLFAFYYLRRASRPAPLVLAALVLIALVGSSFLSDLRGRESRGENIPETVVRSIQPERILSPLRSGPDSEMAPVFAAALAQIPERMDYTYGRTIFGDIVTRPIPRVLWSDKPVPPREKLIASLWPVERQKGGVNPEFSVLLYFYWDFGIFGVIAGMLGFGICARALFAYFLNYRHALSVQVFYSLAMWFVVIGLRNSPVDTFIQAVFVVLPVWIAVRVSRSRRTQVAAAVSR